MSNINNAVFVLGAADPEMQEIETLLRRAAEFNKSVMVVYATVGGSRVHPGNAYKGELPLPQPFTTYCLVECGTDAAHPLGRGPGEYPIWQAADGQLAYTQCPEGGRYVGWYKVVVLDHHRPGDAGYGGKPVNFLPSSTLGQVIDVLLRPAAEGGLDMPCGILGHSVPADNQSGGIYWDGTQWMHGVSNPGYSVPIPQGMVMVAAADHCLPAAYRGQCPGVNPEELMEWRAATRAAFQKRTVADVLYEVDAARRRLRNAVSGGCPECGWSGIDPNTLETCQYCGGEPFPPSEYADVRGENIPELPEAACREGIPFLSEVTEKGGRRKVVLQAAPADLIRRFMAGELVPDLKDYYGDPARGFAGGYVA